MLNNMLNKNEKIYQIALSLIKNIGFVLCKKLINHFGSASNIFEEEMKELKRIPYITKQIAKDITNKQTVIEADKILEMHTNEGIKIITVWEEEYPNRLKQIRNSPILLFMKGDTNLNSNKIISIVGTRKATEYGKKVTHTILNELKPYDIIVVSGLAYGIDICAHKIALDLDIPTIAVLAMGLNIIYPYHHKKIANDMCKKGGLISEHPLNVKPENYQFAARNRIIAGISDATVIIEAPEKSGALITAHYANEYDRDVFAVPNNIYEKYSVGCNNLIKNNQAHMIIDGTDIINSMNWTQHSELLSKHQSKESDKFSNLTDIETKLVDALGKSKDGIHIDELSFKTNMKHNQLASVLLQLEIKQIVKFLPGKKFGLVA